MKKLYIFSLLLTSFSFISTAEKKSCSSRLALACTTPAREKAKHFGNQYFEGGVNIHHTRRANRCLCTSIRAGGSFCCAALSYGLCGTLGAAPGITWGLIETIVAIDSATSGPKKDEVKKDSL